MSITPALEGRVVRCEDPWSDLTRLPNWIFQTLVSKSMVEDCQKRHPKPSNACTHMCIYTHIHTRYTYVTHTSTSYSIMSALCSKSIQKYWVSWFIRRSGCILFTRSFFPLVGVTAVTKTSYYMRQFLGYHLSCYLLVITLFDNILLLFL